jgi:Uncharacterised protein family (UPF0089).
MAPERLTALDASFLYLERPAMHMHVAGLSVLDPSTRPDGRLRFEDVEAGVRLAPAPRAPAPPEGEDGAVRARAPGLGRRRRVRPGRSTSAAQRSRTRRAGRARRAGPEDPLAPARPVQAALGALLHRGSRGRSRRDPDEGASRDDRRAVRHAPDRGAVRPLARAARACAAPRLGARTRTLLAGPAPRGDGVAGRPSVPGADERMDAVRRSPAVAALDVGTVLSGFRSIWTWARAPRRRSTCR